MSKQIERDNPLFYFKREDRRTLLRILYPNVDQDLCFYPENDNEETLDMLNIPKQEQGVFPYIITHNDELRDHLIDTCREWRKMKIEANKDDEK